MNNRAITMFEAAFPFPIVGGKEKQAYLLARSLAKDNYTVNVLSYSFDDTDQFENVDGVNVLRSSKDMFVLLKLIKNLLIFRRQSNVIHIHTPSKVGQFVAIISKILRYKVIFKIPGEKITNKMNSKLLYRIKFKLLSVFIDKFVTVSSGSFDCLCNIRCLKGKAVLFNNGVILNKKILFDNIGTFKFVYVGRLVRLKNVDKMIHLIKILVENNYDVSFDIIGAGPQETFLKNLTAELSLDKYINFIGYAEDVLSFLYKSHCLLLMSDHEGMPNVILEAMSIGLPIISTDVGAVRYMINDDSYLVDDIDDLYRKAILLINNQDKANVYSALLYSRCQTVFSMEIITEQYRNLYLSVNK